MECVSDSECGGQADSRTVRARGLGKMTCNSTFVFPIWSTSIVCPGKLMEMIWKRTKGDRPKTRITGEKINKEHLARFANWSNWN